jgi:hypothetical protein
MSKSEIKMEDPIKEWAMRAAERAFSEAIRWNEGDGPFDIEKVARVIQYEQGLEMPR